MKASELIKLLERYEDFDIVFLVETETLDNANFPSPSLRYKPTNFINDVGHSDKVFSIFLEETTY